MRGATKEHSLDLCGVGERTAWYSYDSADGRRLTEVWEPKNDDGLQLHLYALFVPRAAFVKGQPATPTRLLAQVAVAVLEGGGTVSAALADWAAKNRVRLNVRLRCTSLVQAAGAVKGLGMAATLPIWPQSEFSDHRVTRLSLPALQQLEAPLRLVWSRRQASIRPFMTGLARMPASALAGETSRAVSIVESPRTPRPAAGTDR